MSDCRWLISVVSGVGKLVGFRFGLVKVCSSVEIGVFMGLGFCVWEVLIWCFVVRFFVVWFVVMC